MDIIDCDNLIIEEKEFSSGSFSKVYKGCYYGNPVCVKVIKKDSIIDKELLKFIDSEIDILRDLLYQPHKNIINFIGIGQKESLLFLVTELVNGGDLGTALLNHSIKISWNLRVKMAKDIAEGMNHLHLKSIMHRDLKSNNLLVGKNWNIKICDFGFAKVLKNPLTNTICGSDAFMGPEVILGMNYGYSADVYSFGMVIIELITRNSLEERLPQNSFDIDMDILSQQVPEDCPKEFFELALKCCKYNPKDRPTFKEIIKDLDKLIVEMYIQSHPTSIIAHPPQPIPATPPIVPEIITDPKFDDSSIDQWFMLSLLPEDCLDNPSTVTSLEDKLDLSESLDSQSSEINNNNDIYNNENNNENNNDNNNNSETNTIDESKGNESLNSLSSSENNNNDKVSNKIYDINNNSPTLSRSKKRSWLKSCTIN